MRIFDRAFRRSEVKLAFSKGFNPRPKMSFSPALPLGFTSEAEFVDIEIKSKYSKNLKGKLNSVLPDGIKILNIKRIPKNLPSLTSSINVQEYRIEMTGEDISQQAIRKTLDRHNIIITRDSKGNKKSINIRPYIASISKENGWLKIQTKVIDGRTARINEILAQFYDSSRANLKSLAVHRKNQYIRSTDRQNSPMDVF
jgi:radical SAM-linked protein